MSDIKAGDLVMVARPGICCGDTEDIGKVFTATRVFMCFTSHCNICGDKSAEVLVSDDDDFTAGYPASRLIKINPPSIDESTETKQELPEHA